MKYVVNHVGVLDRISKGFRQKRMRRFLVFFKPGAGDRILDVGGYHATWRQMEVKSRIDLLNIHPMERDAEVGDPPFNEILGDGCALAFGDRSYEIVFSNSVIEHLGTLERQQAFAREAMRVGQALWIQTPARSFFFEPHLMTPFLHYFPSGIRRRLMRNFSVWGLLFRPEPKEIDDFLAEVRLLSFHEMKSLFPGCTILREKFLGMTKSLIAVKGP
jgi:hypothetical protein